MSFGFSVGDFVAVGGLLVKVVDALRGTRSEYQELIRVLESLQGNLFHVEKLRGRGDQAIAVEETKCNALSCRLPLEQFLAKVKKYEKSLGLGRSDGRLKDGGRKVEYAFRMKDEVNRLQKYLTLHIGVINMRIELLGLDRFDVASEQMEKNHKELRSRFDDLARELRGVRSTVEAQSRIYNQDSSMLKKLFWVAIGEIVVPLKSLSPMVAQIYISMQQIYTIVLELRDSVRCIDTRFTYFQDPVRVEDAIGRVFPFPSECSIQALEAEIKARFQEGPGRKEVMAGDFEIFNAKNTNQLLTINGHNILLPGMSINMAIILEKDILSEGDKCPMPRCDSRIFVEALGGGRICSECKVWFNWEENHASKRRRRLEHISRPTEPANRNRDEIQWFSLYVEKLLGFFETKFTMTGTEHVDSEETSISAFKHIRYEPGLQTSKVCKIIPHFIKLLRALARLEKWLHTFERLHTLERWSREVSNFPI